MFIFKIQLKDNLLFVAILCLLLCFSCSRSPLLIETPIEDDTIEMYYDQSSGIVLKKSKDPYSFFNFQNAKSELLSGVNTRALTKEISDALDEFELAPTHLAVTVFPKSEDELSRIEMDPDLRIAYYPFDYQPTYQNNQQAILLYQPESNPHKTILTDVETSSGRHIPELIEDIPIIYVVWPINKTIPDTLDYRIDYDVFLPDYSQAGVGKSKRALKVLECKAINQVMKPNIMTRVENEPDDSVDFKGVGGYIMHYDNYLNTYLPLDNLELRFQLGSHIEYATTRNGGYFNIVAEIPDGSSFYAVFNQPGKWRIRYGTISNTVQYQFGNIEDVLGEGVRYNYDLFLTPSLYGQTSQIHRSLDYYYYGQHNVNKASFSSWIVVTSSNDSNTDYNAVTYVSSSSSYSSPPPITVYNNSSSNSAAMGTVLHELGHETMFYDKGYSPNNFTAVVKFIKESYASFIGWYLCESYYVGFGATQNDGLISCSNQKRQSWTSSLSQLYGRYSPLFIDLMDNYNQHNYSSSYLDDNISGVPYYVIRQIAVNSTTWSSCKTELNYYSGTYYSSTDLIDYLLPYESWFSLYPAEK